MCVCCPFAALVTRKGTGGGLQETIKRLKFENAFNNVPIPPVMINRMYTAIKKNRIYST